jgi:patatin-like phospholipase
MHDGDTGAPDERCASYLRHALEYRHVADHDPPLSIVEVFGTPLTAQLRKAFEKEAFPFFYETADGFVARSRRRPGPTAKGVPRPFGLALSGGGFRATAFHLGVLKRLRELHLLEHVDFVSTVSGGSVAGAYWVHCQAKQDTIHNATEWDRFEASLIRFMMFGARGWVLRYGFWLPLLALLVVALAIHAAWFSFVWPPPTHAIWSLAGALAISIPLAYAWWHYRAARLFECLLDQELFKGATLNDLAQRQSKRDGGRAAPFLIVNATGLSSGDHLLFTPPVAFGSLAGELLVRARAAELRPNEPEEASSSPTPRYSAARPPRCLDAIGTGGSGIVCPAGRLHTIADSRSGAVL